ncbi:T9SS type A sorting domain-containing protein [candidate division KSB1 bacterium]|nr:T9SS type A sorting domain-containing protein [candidate division KSB1 bacterium]
MVKKTLLLSLCILLVLVSMSWSKGIPAKIRGDIGSPAVSINQIEVPGFTAPRGIDFKNYVITGQVVGTTVLDFATAYYGRSVAVGIDGTVHIVWCTTGAPTNEVLYSKSEDHGATWTTPMEVHDGWYGYKPALAVDPKNPDIIYVAYVGYQLQGQTRSIRVSKSTDRGNTWGASVPVYGTVLDGNNPSIAVDYRGWVHVDFDNYTDSYTRYNYSADGGQTWLAEPTIVTFGFADDTFGAGIAIDKKNNVHILTGGGGTAGSWGDKGVFWTWIDMSGINPGDLPLPQEVPPVELAPAGTGLPYPSMVFDSKNNGHLWYDNASAIGTWRGVFYREYKNGVWQEAVEVPASDYANLGATCAIDAQDNLYVMFHDMLSGELGWNWTVWPVDLFTGTNASGEWKYVNVTADGQGVNQQYADCAEWVAGDSILHLVYVTGAAAPYNIVHEKGYPWPPEPTCDVFQLPDTYNLTGPYTVTAATADVDGEVEKTMLHVWKNGTKIQEVEMSRLAKDSYTYTFTLTDGVVGDMIEYQAVALDNDKYQGPSVVTSFKLLIPKNPAADLLVVSDDGRLPAFWEQLLGSLKDTEGNPYAYESWNIQEHHGIDASVSNWGWSTILLHGWVVKSIPTRGYAGNAYAAFLQAGTAAKPKNLLLTSMDYFYANDELASPEELTFQAGDFAYDFFNLATGTSDPDQNADSVLIGSAGDPISDQFAATPLQLRPYSTKDDAGNQVANWIDWTGALEYTNDIFVAESEGLGAGTRFDGTTFKTVLLPWMLCHLVKDTLEAGAFNVPQDEAVALTENILKWFGTKKGESSGVGTETNLVVDHFELGQNYPNPFNPTTSIGYRLSKSVDVRLTVYNTLGQAIRSLVNQKLAAGQHTITWNGTNDAGQPVTSGTYFYKIQAGDFVQVNKMVLLK